jgi:general secretion pathway protein G
MIRRKPQAFTLIELLLVLVILAILAAVIVPSLARRSEEAKIKGTIADIAVLKTSLSMFMLDNGRYPMTEEGLGTLVEAPGNLVDSWKGPYVEQLTPDKWGRAYRYFNPAPDDPTNYLLFSCGGDGQEYTADDITQYTTAVARSGN